METLVNQKADEKWKRDLKESQDADHKAIMDQLAAGDFLQRVMASKLMENQNEIKVISMMMQKVRKLYGGGLDSLTYVIRA